MPPFIHQVYEKMVIKGKELMCGGEMGGEKESCGLGNFHKMASVAVCSWRFSTMSGMHIWVDNKLKGL